MVQFSSMVIDAFSYPANQSTPYNCMLVHPMVTLQNRNIKVQSSEQTKIFKKSKYYEQVHHALFFSFSFFFFSFEGESTHIVLSYKENSY